MVKWIGIVLLALGGLSALAGAAWNLLLPSPDANIGAGLLVVVGLPVAGLGLIVLVIAVLLSRIGKA